MAAPGLGQSLDNKLRALSRVSRLMLIVGRQSGPGRLRHCVEFCNPAPGVDFVAAIAGEEIGTEVSRLDAGHLDTKWCYLLPQGFGVNGNGGFASAVQARCWTPRPAGDGAQVGHGSCTLGAHPGENSAEDAQLAKDVDPKVIFDFFGAMTVSKGFSTASLVRLPQRLNYWFALLTRTWGWRDPSGRVWVRRLPAFLNGTFKNVSRIVDQDIDVANPLDDLVDTGLNVLITGANVQMLGNDIAH